MKVGFVGLGGMGSAMVESIAAAGHEVVVWNRARARADALRGKIARVADSPAEVARAAEVVVSMVADDAAVEAVTLGGSGILHGLAAGAVHVSSSTISVALSDELAREHAARKQGYVAAPVFGRPEAAAQRQLWVVAAGAAPDLDRCAPIFDAVGRGATRVGERPSMANSVKLAGNFVIAAMLETLGEAFALALKSGVSAETFCEVFIQVFARSPIFEGYAKRIAAEAYEPAGFTARLGTKDLRLVLGAADAREVPMPIAAVVHGQLLAALAQGRGHLDWSALARFAAERAGIHPTK
jgi:3-hydroxyisobutyrate dehydrogenase-like beta-hydroxyacid dehydrogenase